MTASTKSKKAAQTKASAQPAAAPRVPEQPRSYLLLAIWFTIVAGFLELGILWARVLIQGQVIPGSTNLHLPWRTFLAELLVYGPIGGVLFLWACWRPRWMTAGAAGFLMALPLVFTLRSIFSQTPWYAWAVLNVGVAIGIGRLVSSRFVLIRRMQWGLIPAAAILCLSFGLKDAVAEYRALAALPPPEPGAPNILLVVLDTVRAHSMSLHGYQLETTPRIAEWAQRGVCFERAVAPSSWTLASHATFFTGHMPHEMFRDWRRMHNVPWQLPMDEQFPTLAELLAGQGYRTGGFVANWTYCDRVYGLARGFAHYEDQLVFSDHGISAQQFLNCAYIPGLAATEIYKPRVHDAPAGTPGPDIKLDPGLEQTLHAHVSRKEAPRVNRDFLSWAEKDKTRPFFAFLNYMDTHDPFVRHEDFAKRLTARAYQSQPDAPRMTPLAQQLGPFRLDYDSSLAFLDHHIGALLDELQSRDLLRSTVVFIVSDHGEQFGEHNRGGHGNSLYTQLIHVPFVVLCPEQIPAGVRVVQPVSLANLAATILDVACFPDTKAVPGKSLAPFWRDGKPPHADAVYSELDKIMNVPQDHSVFRMRSVIDEGYHYIVNHHDGKQLLFHWIDDPYEERNLALRPEQTERIERLHALVRERGAIQSQ